MPTLDVHSGFQPHPAQWAILKCPVRFIVADCGRRFGKTELTRANAGQYAAKGQRYGYFTLKNGTMEQIWEDVKSWLKPIIKDKSEQFHRLEYFNGGIAEFWSLENEDAGLGRKYHHVDIDEAAIVKSVRSWQRNIRPTLTDYRGSANFYSTPRGRNWFHELFRRGQDPRWPTWASFQFPTSANPHIDPEEIEEARLSLPERVFRQEYLAEFLSDEGEVFRNVDAQATATEQDHAIDGHVYTVGVDWGRDFDYSCFVVYDCTLRSIVYVDRSNSVEYMTQIGRLEALNVQFHPQVIYAEDNSVAGVMEMLERRSLPIITFHTTAPLKMLFVDAFASALEQRNLQLVNHEQLIDELKAFRPYQLPSGLVRYSAPDGQHDDTVMAAMAAYYAGQNQTAGEAAIYRFAHVG